MYQHSKIFTILLAFLCLTMTAVAQNPIPNPGFENWTEGEPDGWLTYNSPFATFITQSSTSHSGSYAVKGAVATYFEVATTPILITDVEHVPISQNYASFTGYYQFSTSGSDSFYVYVLLFDAQYSGVAVGAKVLGATNAGYNKFTVDIEYFPFATEPAAYALLQFLIISESDTVDPSGTFLLDDVEFSGITAIGSEIAIKAPENFKLDQNYPNPFNPETNIKFQLPNAEFVTITVYNTLGQMVETLLNKEMPVGIHQVRFDAKDLAGGVYFYKMQAGSFVQMRKMVLVK